MAQAARAVDRKGRVRFGVFEADLKSGELRRSGIRVRLQSQPFKVLTVLLESPGEVVSREVLQERIWGHDTNVNFDHSLGIAINKLREALGDSADNPRFIETLARRGYRFIAPILTDAPVLLPVAAAPVEQQAKPSRRFTQSLWMAACVGLLLAVLVVQLTLRRRPASSKPRRITAITYSGRVLEPRLDISSTSAAVTDGARLYFSQTKNGQIGLAQTLIANGEIGEFSLPSEIASPVISSLSPDKAELIVHNQQVNDPEQPFWIVPTLGGNAQRIPNLLAHDATWMPDGKRILFAQGNRLLIAQRDGSEVQTFADLPGWAFWLRWSSDGKTLRFSLRDPDHQTSSLWEWQNGRLHPLLDGWSQPSSECCGSWTGDGKDYVFQSRHGGRSDLWMRREGRGWGDPLQLTNGPLDYEAPVGGIQDHRVYFVGANPEIELFRFHPEANNFAPMEGSFSSAGLMAFSRDGQWVAWLSTMDGSLWRSRTDGSERFQLTAPPLRIFMMRWSPDNRHLAIMAEEPGQPWKIYLQDAAGGRLEPLLNESRNEADPDWSADGQSLVMGRLPQHMSPEQTAKALYMVDVKTRSVSELPNSVGLFSPRLSPDSRYVAALSLEQRSLQMLDRQTNQWRTLTTHAVADPQWSSDSRFLFFQETLESGKPIYRVDIRTGSLTLIAKLENLRPLSARDYRLIALAPGDQPIVSAWTSNVNLYSIDLDE